MNLLVTGCCGFIGSNFVKLLLAERPGWRIANLDALTYAGNRANLEDEEKNSPDYFFCHGDIRRPEDVERAIGMLPGPVDAIVNLPRKATSTTPSATPASSWRPTWAGPRSCSRPRARRSAASCR